MTAAEEAEKWAYGHRFAQHHRGRASGMVTTLIPTPGKGKFEVTPVSMNSLGNFDSGGGKFDGDPDERQYNHRVPKLDFPKFDGSDPQDWRMRCEHYFDVNNTYPGLWVRVATIYFIGRAASWLRSSRAHVRYPVWEEFSATMSSKFDKDQHDLLIRQMDQIRQTGTVWEFYEHFDELMNQLLAYDPEVNMRYLIHRFTEGLHREIRNAVLLHRPRDLETALAIASLQEEVLEVVPESNHSKPFRRSDGGVQPKNSSAFKGAFPLPLPPGSGGVRADDKKHQDGQRATGLLTRCHLLRLIVGLKGYVTFVPKNGHLLTNVPPLCNCTQYRSCFPCCKMVNNLL